MAAAAHTRIPELSGIEFTGHAAVAEYSKALRALCRDLSFEIEFAAEEIYAVLSRQKGHPLLLGLDVRLRARRVANRLRRAEELTAGAAVEAVKFYVEFRRQFAEAINPPAQRSAKAFNFDDGDA
jgi:hypothetical protein